MSTSSRDIVERNLTPGREDPSEGGELGGISGGGGPRPGPSGGGGKNLSTSSSGDMEDKFRNEDSLRMLAIRVVMSEGERDSFGLGACLGEWEENQIPGGRGSSSSVEARGGVKTSSSTIFNLELEAAWACSEGYKVGGHLGWW